MKSHLTASQPNNRLHSRNNGFTLIELVASMALLSMLMLACVTAIDSVRRSVVQVRGKAEQFREARLAFDLITNTLSQATLNTYWDYYYQETASNTPPAESIVSPKAYVRYSELQFLTGTTSDLLGEDFSSSRYPGHALFFQAPLGLSHSDEGGGSLLNARGFAIQFGSDETNLPAFLSDYAIPARKRYRLIEYRPPAEQSGGASGNTIYSKPTAWFREEFESSTRVVADNIILLLISPRVSPAQATAEKKTPTWIAPQYRYNSTDTDNTTPKIDALTVAADGIAQQGTQHLLPPLVQVTMVALDEVSARKWAERNEDEPVDLSKLANAPFDNAAQHDRDLKSLESYLDAERLNYQIFSTTVTLRNARWDSRTF